MTRMEELESCLSGLLSTLKKNREHVPLEVLKTQYKQPYEELVRNINLTASAYAKSVLLHRLVLNPDADVEEQCRTDISSDTGTTPYGRTGTLALCESGNLSGRRSG